MKRACRILAGVAVVLLGGVLGCKSKEIKVQRPERPDQYVLPPDHARFSQPIAYPKDLLNKTSAPKTEPSQINPTPTRPISQMGQPGPMM